MLGFINRLEDWHHNKDGSRLHSSKHSSRNNSVQGTRTASEKQLPGPAATSSPLEEHGSYPAQIGSFPVQIGNFPAQIGRVGKSKTSVVSSEEAGSRHRRPRSTKAASSIRTSASGNTHRDNDGRRPNYKPGGRVSKSRPRHHEHSSSEDSGQNTRPDRVNSSAYSEQDIVPSLVNQPKGNVYGSRHRPKTAESNVDSGFVGSEGTLRSQELLNGGKQPIFKRNKQPKNKHTLERYSGSEEEVVPDLQLGPVDTTRNDSSVRSEGRVSRGSRNPRSTRKDYEASLLQSETWDAYSAPDARSMLLPNASSQLREKSHKHGGDQVISFGSSRISDHRKSEIPSRHIPVIIERSPFRNDAASLGRLESERSTGERLRDNYAQLQNQLNAKRHQLDKRPSLTNTTASQLPGFRYDDDDDVYARLPNTRAGRSNDRRGSLRDGEEFLEYSFIPISRS